MKTCPLCYKPAPSDAALCQACGGALIDSDPAATRSSPNAFVDCPWCNARAGLASAYADSRQYHCPHCAKAFRLKRGTPLRSDGISTTAKILIVILFIIIVIPLIFIVIGAV